ncbi:hypothetical protein TrVGV298_011976 [Trichoderma virens]|nr:hypothetical protein TrVGV298_011976 [Trichoderma virens]
MSSNVPDPDAFFALYRYVPSLEAAAVAVLAFAIITGMHGWRMLQVRSFYFTPFVIGGVFEVIGYSGRIWSHYDLSSIGGYIIQQLFILLAPALFAASIYMILGRLIRVLTAEEYSFIPLRFLTKIFVLGDVISFLAQAGGGGVQLSAHPTQAAIDEVVPWRRYLTVLYSASGIILVRSVFRIIEYLQGNNGYIIRREYLLYIFDAVLMFLVMVLFLINYIGNLEHRQTHAKLEEDEEFEMMN